MPRTYPDPWPTTDAEVLKWKINNGYDFLLERLELPEKLFSSYPYSLDGIALTMVVFSALADYHGIYTRPKSDGTATDLFGGNKKHLRELLSSFSPKLVNRISIPELARALRDASTEKMLLIKPLLQPMLAKFAISGMHATRLPEDDPTVEEFKTWATSWTSSSHLTVPKVIYENYDYAGLLFRHYRNSVIHSLRVAEGREANYTTNEVTGEPSLVFYSNHHHSSAIDIYDKIRIGFHPTKILELAKDVIENVRTWALAKGVDIFPD